MCCNPQHRDDSFESHVLSYWNVVAKPAPLENFSSSLVMETSAAEMIRVNQTFRMRTLGILCVFALLTSVTSAATITGGSITSDVSGPVPDNSGEGSGSAGGSVRNFVGVRASSNLIKFVGDLSIETASGGSTFDNTLKITGQAELDAGDTFSLAYDYSATIIGGGTLTLTTTAITDFEGDNTVLNETLTSIEEVSGPGEFFFSLPGLPATATEFVSGSWTGELAFDWVNAPENSSLLISIPNNSIDFIVASAVPEPGSVSLGFAVCVFAAIRRRRKA